MMMILPPTKFLHVHDGEMLAYIHSSKNSQQTSSSHSSPGIMYLPGFMSNMRSTKPQAIFNFCEQHSLEFTTLDYYGHGESTSFAGKEKGSIGRWIHDAKLVFDNVPSKSCKQIIVGASMGSWIMTHLAHGRLEEVDGLVGIASAPDFTELMAESIYNDKMLSSQMDTKGYCDLPTDYDISGYYRIYKSFLDEAKKHLIFLSSGSSGGEVDKLLSLFFDFDNVPIRLLHGTHDKDINYKYSEALFDKMQSSDKKLILVDGGDHRLSKPNDIKVILETLERLLFRSDF